MYTVAYTPFANHSFAFLFSCKLKDGPTVRESVCAPYAHLEVFKAMVGTRRFLRKRKKMQA